MKKLITILLIAIGFAINIQAQPKGFYYYSRLGLGTSKFDKSNLSNQTEKLALNIGIAGNYQFNKYLGLMVEANLSSKGAKITGSEPATFTSAAKPYEDVYRLFYAEIPLIIKASYPLTDQFYIKAFSGFSNNFNLLGTVSRNYDNPNEADQLDQSVNGIKLLENSFVFGLGFEVLANSENLYSLDFRTNRGLNSFGNIKNSQNSVISGYNSYYTIGFGYSF